MTIFLKVIMLALVIIGFMVLIAEPDKETKIIYASVTIAAICGSVTAFIFL